MSAYIKFYHDGMTCANTRPEDPGVQIRALTIDHALGISASDDVYYYSIFVVIIIILKRSEVASVMIRIGEEVTINIVTNM